MPDLVNYVVLYSYMVWYNLDTGHLWVTGLNPVSHPYKHLRPTINFGVLLVII